MSRRRPLRFWGSALLAAALVAALATLVPLYPPLGLETAMERQRAWLLTVWTAGVMAVLFGLSARLGGLRVLGFREVASAGSLRAALEERRRAGRGGGSEPAGSFDLWVVATGALLIGIYFAGWALLERVALP